MTGRASRVTAIHLAVLLLSCGDPDPIALDGIGDPCRSDYSFCLDSSSVQRCEEGIWVVAPCAAVCEELGMAYTAGGCSETCDCILRDPEGCVPGDSVCVSESELSVCDNSQSWSRFDCASVCAESGFASAGCMEETEDASASCWCTSEGAACTPEEASICVDEGTLANCVDGAWVFHACDDSCNGSGMCDPAESPHVCACP